MLPSRASLGSLIVLIVTLSAIVVAQPPRGGAGPVLGIVEIPVVFAVDSQTGQISPTAALTLYSTPSDNSKVATIMSSPDAIDSAEYGYEELGALVYGRDRGYYSIRTARGMAWLSPRDAGPFHSYETLVGTGLTFLTDAWDGFVSASPGSPDRVSLAPRSRPPAGNDEDVRVNGFRTVAGKLWVQIEVMSDSGCESSDPPAVKARGWVPAHDASGAPTVWFYSRGC
jgi:hypothetical protein